MRERRLTVSRLHRPRPGGFYPCSHVPDVVVPFVRLSGRWLAELGFRPGERLRVEAAPGRLVLTSAAPAGEVAEASASSPGSGVRQQGAGSRTPARGSGSGRRG